MIVAVARKDRLCNVPTGDDAHRLTASDVSSLVQSRIGWKPVRVVPGARGVWWAYRR
jgi:hypothetical protein